MTVHGNKIQYIIQYQEDVTLTVIDLLGNEIMRKSAQNQAACSYEFTFEKKQNGVFYLVTLETCHYKINRKF